MTTETDWRELQICVSASVTERPAANKVDRKPGGCNHNLSGVEDPLQLLLARERVDRLVSSAASGTSQT